MRAYEKSKGMMLRSWKVLKRILMRFEFIDCALLLQGRCRVRTMVCGGWNTDALGFFVGPDTFD